MSGETVKKLTVYTLAEDYTGYDSLFWASFGISFLLRIESGGGKKTLLFDTASDPEPILHNIRLLELSLEDIDAIVLSHRHFDHTGGLAGVLREIHRMDIPIIVHPRIFDVTVNDVPYLEPHRSRLFLNEGLSGENRKDNITSLGGRWFCVKDPFPILPGVMTTGEIEDEEKVSYERDPHLNLFDIKDGGLIKASAVDDISLCINTSGGLVVITGCSHAGIVSITKKAIRLTGTDTVRAIIGGFHLINANDELIDRTVKDLEEMRIERIFSGHCTGSNAEYRLRQVFGERFERLHSGKTIEF
ncbi:MAG: MBL fold metallo-hydrolase [Spirochaetes bacterium]|nr:MBL fold metallo-hydrolase [Spirochaetota bacterium]